MTVGSGGESMGDSEAGCPGGPSDVAWSVEYWVDGRGHSPFEHWFERLPERKQAVVAEVLSQVVAVLGPDICKSEWGKSLGGGLYEIRIRRWLNEEKTGDSGPLLRIFCTFHGAKVVLLFQGYDKGKDTSGRRQQKEISQARRYYREWKRAG